MFPLIKQNNVKLVSNNCGEFASYAGSLASSWAKHTRCSIIWQPSETERLRLGPTHVCLWKLTLVAYWSNTAFQSLVTDIFRVQWLKQRHKGILDEAEHSTLYCVKHAAPTVYSSITQRPGECVNTCMFEWSYLVRWAYSVL